MAELENRTATEQTFAARIARLNSRQRHELEQLLGWPPNPANVPASFWVQVENDMKSELAIILLLIFSASAAQHGLGGPAISTFGDGFAIARANEVGADFAANTRDRLDSLSTRWEEQIRTGTLNRGQVQTDLVDVLGPSTAERIATTETTVATSAGGEAAAHQNGGIQQTDTWYTEKDGRVCPLCAPLHKAGRDEWMAQFPSGPPAHPRCRCWIEYAFEKELAGNTT